MVGEDGLQEELEMVGLRVVKEKTRPPAGMTEDEFRENDHDPEVTCFCRWKVLSSLWRRWWCGAAQLATLEGGQLRWYHYHSRTHGENHVLTYRRTQMTGPTFAWLQSVNTLKPCRTPPLSLPFSRAPISVCVSGGGNR